MSYAELAGFLAAEAASLDTSDGSETLRNLISGVLVELAARGLAEGLGVAPEAPSQPVRLREVQCGGP